MSNNTLGTQLRATLGLSQTAPATVTTYTVSVMGFPTTGVDGTDGADNLQATATTNYLFGMGGNDTLDAANGAANLIGGTGSDVFVANKGSVAVYTTRIGDFELGSDRIDLSQTGITSFNQFTVSLGGTGNNSATLTSGNTQILMTSLDNLGSLGASSFIFAGSGTSTGGGATTVGATSGPDSLSGQAIAELFEGGAGADLLAGFGGNDTLYGNTDNDTVTGNRNDDLLFGGQGNDKMEGNLDNDTMFGNMGNDTMHGGAGNDTLHGGQGDDTLAGGDGTDSLNGGAGNDVFVYSSLSGTDHIYGFQGAGAVGGDVIQIASSLVGSTSVSIAVIDGDSTIMFSSGHAIVVEDVTNLSVSDLAFV